MLLYKLRLSMLSGKLVVLDSVFIDNYVRTSIGTYLDAVRYLEAFLKVASK